MNCMDIKIESERLLLVPIALKHAEDMFKTFNDEITKYMTPKPADDISQTKDFIKSSLSRMKNNSNIQLVILIRETKELIGCVGLHDINTKTPEFGIWTKNISHGNGYGKEAIHVLYDWACNHLEFDYITLSCG
ncbi:MAG: GNAT family N-acetyltransferase [Clostridiales bacterium]|nr:GNAT family N-acetyltransferase [Clostridiales bacterium]